MLTGSFSITFRMKWQIAMVLNRSISASFVERYTCK